MDGHWDRRTENTLLGRKHILYPMTHERKRTKKWKNEVDKQQTYTNTTKIEKQTHLGKISPTF